MNGSLMEDRLSGKSPRGGVVWPWRLTIFSFTLIVIAAAVFVGLRFGYGKYIREEIVATDMAIADLAAGISAEDQDRFLSFYRQLAGLKSIMDNHVAASKVFDWLERQTHERVFFKSLDFNPQNQTLSLNAVADSYEVVIQQLEALERLSEVESYQTSRIQKSEDRTTFDLLIKLQSNTYRY